MSPLLRMRPPPSWGRGGRAHGEVRGVGGPPLPGPPITRKLAVFSETSTNRPSEAPEVKTSPPGGLQVVLEVEVVTGARGLRCREVYKSPPRKPRRSTSRPGRSTSRHPAAQVAPGRSRSRSRKPRRSTNRPREVYKSFSRSRSLLVPAACGVSQKLAEYSFAGPGDVHVLRANTRRSGFRDEP